MRRNEKKQNNTIKVKHKVQLTKSKPYLKVLQVQLKQHTRLIYLVEV